MSEGFYAGLCEAYLDGSLGEFLQDHWEELGRDSMAFSVGTARRGGATLAWRIGLCLLIEDAVLEDMGLEVDEFGVLDVPVEQIGGLIEGAESAHVSGE